MLGVELVPAVIFTLIVHALPESPRWLVRRGEKDKAIGILSQVCSTEEATSIAASVESEADTPVSSFRSIMKRTCSVPLMLAVLLAFFNQVSGINAVLYYAPRIFELAGSNESAALLSSVGIGVVNIVFTIVGMAAIDKYGRRALMKVGSVDYITSLSIIAYGFAFDQAHLIMPFIFISIASHAVGQGAVIWVYISEILPNEARTMGQAVGCGTHWVLAGAITLFMPLLLVNAGPAHVFTGFAIMMVLQLVFVLFWMVETKGKTLEELRSELVLFAKRLPGIERIEDVYGKA